MNGAKGTEERDWLVVAARNAKVALLSEQATGEQATNDE